MPKKLIAIEVHDEITRKDKIWFQKHPQARWRFRDFGPKEQEALQLAGGVCLSLLQALPHLAEHSGGTVSVCVFKLADNARIRLPVLKLSKGHKIMWPHDDGSIQETEPETVLNYFAQAEIPTEISEEIERCARCGRQDIPGDAMLMFERWAPLHVCLACALVTMNDGDGGLLVAGGIFIVPNMDEAADARMLQSIEFLQKLGIGPRKGTP